MLRLVLGFNGSRFTVGDAASSRSIRVPERHLRFNRESGTARLRRASAFAGLPPSPGFRLRRATARQVGATSRRDKLNLEPGNLRKYTILRPALHKMQQLTGARQRVLVQPVGRARDRQLSEVLGLTPSGSSLIGSTASLPSAGQRVLPYYYPPKTCFLDKFLLTTAS